MEGETLDALLAHARALVGVELSELADTLGLPVPVGRLRTKGWSGQVIEHELGVAVGGTRGPDFAALGVELKTVPVQGIAGAARIDRRLSDRSGRHRGGVLGVELRAREAGPRPVRRARRPPRRPLRRRAPRRRRAPLVPRRRRRPRPARRLRALRARLLPPGARRRDHRPPRRACCRSVPRGETPTICATPTTPPATRPASASTASTCVPPSSRGSCGAPSLASAHSLHPPRPDSRPGCPFESGMASHQTSAESNGRATKPAATRAENETCAESSGAGRGRCGCRSRRPERGAVLAKGRAESRAADLRCRTSLDQRLTRASRCRSPSEQRRGYRRFVRHAYSEHSNAPSRGRPSIASG